MTVSRMELLQLNQFLDSKVRWHLGTAGKTQLIGIMTCDEAVKLLYDVFVVHYTKNSRIDIARGRKYKVDTDDSGNITIHLGSVEVHSDDTMIDSLIFEACNAKAQFTAPRSQIMSGFSAQGTGGTRSKHHGLRTGKWEAVNMLLYVKIAEKIPAKYRTNNMKKAIEKWNAAGNNDGVFIVQQVNAPHDSKHVTPGGVPTNRMGLTTKVLYSYEYICLRDRHNVFMDDLLCAVLNPSRGPSPVRYSSTNRTYSENTNLRGASYTNDQTSQSIGLGNWICQNWPAGKSDKPERVLLVHDTIKSCQTNPALSVFRKIQPADFGLNFHTEAIALKEATNKTRHRYP